MSNINCNTTATILNRTTRISPRTYNTHTGWIVWLTKTEAKALKLRGYTSGYSYSVDLNGNVERWVNGYGGYVAKIQAPQIVR